MAYRKWAVGDAAEPMLIMAVMGAMGLAHLVIFVAFFPILNATGIEVFEWPTGVEFDRLTVAAFLALSGNIGLMFSLALLPPLIVSVSGMLTVPLSG